jgi:ABC-type glycerol-3-phosphate transport system permease component
MVSTALAGCRDQWPHPTCSRHARPSLTPRRGQPAVLDAVKNSLIIVGITVVLDVLAFPAAVALGAPLQWRSLFVVAMIGILMLPQVGLVIPLYVVPPSTTTSDTRRGR